MSSNHRPLNYRLKLLWVRYGDIMLPAVVAALVVVLFLALIFIRSLKGDIANLNHEVTVINHYLHITKTVHTKSTVVKHTHHTVTHMISHGVTGPRGAAGSAGAVGPAGSQGIPGHAGTQGPRGSRGFRGYRGYRGKSGTRGLRGLQGIPGVGPTVQQVIAALCTGVSRLSTLCNGVMGLVR